MIRVKIAALIAAALVAMAITGMAGADDQSDTGGYSAPQTSGGNDTANAPYTPPAPPPEPEWAPQPDPEPCHTTFVPNPFGEVPVCLSGDVEERPHDDIGENEPPEIEPPQ